MPSVQISDYMLSYEELLKRGMGNVPKNIKSADRFEIPAAQVLVQGSRTIINNFNELAAMLRREPAHLLKFLLKELATSREVKEKKIVLIGNFSQDLINKKVETYVKTFVICAECKKPDTKIIKEERFTFMKCEACGAKHPLPKV